MRNSKNSSTKKPSRLSLPKTATIAFINLTAEHLTISRYEAFQYRLYGYLHQHLKEFLNYVAEHKKTGRNFHEDAYTPEFHENFLNQLLYCRCVDDFLIYLSDMLSLIYRYRPKALKSSENYPLDFVLSHGTLEEFVRSVAAKRVFNASRGGYIELLKHFSKLGIPTNTITELEKMAKHVDIRHKIVHQRGIQYNIFKIEPEKINKEPSVEITYDEFQNCIHDVFLAATVMESQCSKKFKLPTFPLQHT